MLLVVVLFSSRRSHLAVLGFGIGLSSTCLPATRRDFDDE
jgi:hypothetical protein